MKWNLRLTAAKKGIWKAAELQRKLADHGLVISTAKMSGLWSGQPLSLKLKDLDVMCVVLDCEISDLLVPEPENVSRPAHRSAKPVAPEEPDADTPLIPRQSDARSFPWSDPMARYPNAQRAD